MENKKKIISFDVWDTIIKRKCHPEETKLYTAKYIYLSCNDKLVKDYADIYKILLRRDEIEEKFVRQKASQHEDEEYRILDVLNELQKDILGCDTPDVELSKEWVRAEVEQEKRVTYINPDILPVFEKYKDLDMYCISDFYMSGEDLEEIINNLNLPVKFKKVFCSSDYLLNKKSGNLYKQAEKELNITPAEHIHVGDNDYSDIQIANSIGIETIKINKTPPYFEPKRERNFKFDFSQIKKDDTTIENRLYNLGTELSPLLYFFVYNIVEHAIRNKINHVYYFTREGEKFIKIHEKFEARNPFGVTLPTCSLLEVSRMATFSASLNNFSIGELLRLWSQYRVQSMKALFKTLAIDITQYQKYMDKYEINIEEDIYEPWFNIKVQKLFRDEEFVNSVNEKLKEKRQQLIEYFENQNIVNDDKKILCVDIGWRGTIQDNLAYIFNKKTIEGYYITLFDYYNAQPKNTKKYKFIKNKDVILQDVAPALTVFEMIFSSNTGSVIEYKDGIAIRKAKKEETEIVQKYITYIQEGIFAGADIINEYMEIHPFEASEFDRYIENLVTNVRKNPNKDLMEVYYKLVMNDTFGTGKYVDKNGNKLSLLGRLNIFKCRKQLQNETWKEAYIKYNHIEYIYVLMKVKSFIRKIIRR
ncbi:MAG: HAD family hydrolase [Clostridia bacterium]|nr:HAD family hydrolase [Clostridia bacterium]